MLLLLAACLHRTSADPVEIFLADADSAWVDRDDGGLDPVEPPLMQAWQIRPDSPQVLWRFARLDYALGAAADDPGDARASYANGRAHAMACLGITPQLQTAADAHDEKDVVAVLTPVQADCAAWGALNWARWWVAFGPRAAVADLPSIIALNDRAEALGADPMLIAWTRGLVAAGRPDRPDLDKALTLFRQAIDEGGPEVVIRADIAELVADPVQNEPLKREQVDAIAASTDRTPEAVATKKRFDPAE